MTSLLWKPVFPSPSLVTTASDYVAMPPHGQLAYNHISMYVLKFTLEVDDFPEITKHHKTHVH
jgi:hypothetical protein